MWRDICWKETLNWEEEPVLALDLSVPLPVEEDRGGVRMGRWCARLAAVWYRRWTGPLYRQACAALEEARASARPFWHWSAGLTWTLARVEAGLEAMRREGVSLRRDAKARAEKTLDPGRFFLGPEGPTLYYPMGALGPNSSGILEFPLWEKAGSGTFYGQKNPEKV